jgi:hypothetical protein
MLSKQEEQQERLDVLRNDQRLRNPGSTFSQFAASEASTPLGRFSAISAPHVVGSESIPKYPAAFLQHDPVPTEPPLGYSIEAQEPLGPTPAQAPDPNPAHDDAPPIFSLGSRC